MSPQFQFDILPESIKSEYIETGFAHEKIYIRNVKYDLEAKTAEAEVDVETDFRNSYCARDNSFHWSAITAYRAASQLAVGYICTEMGKTKREIGEILQIKSSLETRASIHQISDVPIEMNFIKYIKRDSKIIGEIEFLIAKGNFRGKIRFAIKIH